MTDLGRKRHIATIWPDVVVVAGLFVLTVGLFLRILLGHNWIVYGHALTPDIFNHYALETVVRAALAQGEFPLWNPYYGAGTPLLADFRASILYPITAALRWLPLSKVAAFNWDGVVHMWLAGVGMYILVRDLGGGRAAATFSAAAYMFSGSLVPRFYVGHFVVIHSMAWPGWLLFAYRRLLLDRSWWSLIATVVFTSLALVSRTHPQFMMVILAIPACYLGFYAVRQMRSGKWRELRIAVGLSLAVGVLAAGLSAVQILPTMEAFRYSARIEGYSLEEASTVSLKISQLLTMVIPFLLFDMSTNTPLGFEVFFEQSIYSGLFTLVLAAAALFAPGDEQRRFARFLLIPALIGLALITRNSPLFRIVHGLMPFIKHSGRFAQIWVLCVVVMGGLGLEAVVRVLESGEQNVVAVWAKWLCIVISGAALVVLGVTVVWLVRGERLTVMIQARGYFDFIDTSLFASAQQRNLVNLSITVVILTIVAWIGALRLLPARRWAWVVVGGLLVELAIYAWPLVTPHDAMELYDPASPLANAKLDAAEIRLEGRGREPVAYLIPTVEARNTFELERFAKVRELGMRGGRGSQLLSSGYVVESGVPGDPDLKAVRRVGEVTLYAYANNLPRIYAAPAVRVVRDDEEALAFVASEEFEPFETAVVVTTGREVPGLPRSAEGEAHVAAEMLEYTPNGLRARVETDVPVMVVFSEMYYPGWDAWVDSEEVTVWRANYAFRGVEVGAGTHIVEMKYRPASFRLGAVISGATLIVMMVLISLGVIGRRTQTGRA